MTLSLDKPKLDNLANEIWKSAERLRGKFKACECQNAILPNINGFSKNVDDIMPRTNDGALLFLQTMLAFGNKRKRKWPGSVHRKRLKPISHDDLQTIQHHPQIDPSYHFLVFV